MAVGITAIGSYVPYWRIERKTIGQAWSRGSMKGEKSVGNTDEDSLTMGVESAIRCFTDTNRENIGALLFASNTAPYSEKSTAATIATVCDLAQDIFTADLSGSTKAGANALKLAFGLAGTKDVLVTASDTRAGWPKSDQEQLFGDAAASVVVGTDGIIAELVDTYSVNNEIIDVWRNTGEQYINYGEGRFIMDNGYTAAMKKAVAGILKKSGKTAAEFSKIILSTPGMKDGDGIAKKNGFTPEQMQNNFMLEVGNSGAAQPLFMLADAIENAKDGDLLLMAAYGNGADAFIFKVTGKVGGLKKHNTVQNSIATKRTLTSYTKYLSFRGHLEAVAGEPFRTFPSNAAYWREGDGILKLIGSKCNCCGSSIYPVHRICYNCGTKDEFKKVNLSGRTAKVFTYSIDNLAGSSEDPVVVQTVADDAEGFRYYLIMTDFEQKEVAIGQEVEFTFRKMYIGGNYVNYYWKCRPVKRGGAQ